MISVFLATSTFADYSGIFWHSTSLHVNDRDGSVYCCIDNTEELSMILLINDVKICPWCCKIGVLQHHQDALEGNECLSIH